MRVARVEELMGEMRIDSLPVVGTDRRVVEILDIQDLVAGAVQQQVNRIA
jgi:hypothetical protein